MLRRLGAAVVEVRKPEQLDGLDGLVLPGGESTAFMRLMRLYRLDEALHGFGGAVFGTCAGMIVLDHGGTEPPQHRGVLPEISLHRKDTDAKRLHRRQW